MWDIAGLRKDAKWNIDWLPRDGAMDGMSHLISLLTPTGDVIVVTGEGTRGGMVMGLYNWRQKKEIKTVCIETEEPGYGRMFNIPWHSL